MRHRRNSPYISYSYIAPCTIPQTVRAAESPAIPPSRLFRGSTLSCPSVPTARAAASAQGRRTSPDCGLAALSGVIEISPLRGEVFFRNILKYGVGRTLNANAVSRMQALACPNGERSEQNQRIVSTANPNANAVSTFPFFCLSLPRFLKRAIFNITN